MKPYFVILSGQDDQPIPLMEIDGMTGNTKLAQFESKSDACREAAQTPFGHAFGFEVFRLGNGV